MTEEQSRQQPQEGAPQQRKEKCTEHPRQKMHVTQAAPGSASVGKCAIFAAIKWLRESTSNNNAESKRPKQRNNNSKSGRENMSCT